MGARSGFDVDEHAPSASVRGGGCGGRHGSRINDVASQGPEMDAHQARLDRSETCPFPPKHSRMGDDLRPPTVTPGDRSGGGVRKCEEVGCPCHQELEVTIVPVGIGVVRVAKIVDGVHQRDLRTVQLIAPCGQPYWADVIEPEVQVSNFDGARRAARSSLNPVRGAATRGSSDRPA